MRLAYLTGPTVYNKLIIPELEKLGVDIVDIDDSPDIVWNESVDKFKQARHERKRSGAFLVNYVWDLYKWAIERKRQDQYNWPGYIQFVKESDLVIVPNVGTQLRVKEFANMESHVVHTAVDCVNVDVPMGDYVLNPLREYPDPHWGWTKQACDELGIDYLWPDHGISGSEWPKVVAAARLMVCEYEEASTGGLTLIEGLWNGVPSIVYDGPYSGGKEYLGEYGHTFSTYQDLKNQIKMVYDSSKRVDAREFIQAHYSPEVMALQLYRLFKEKLHV